MKYVVKLLILSTLYIGLNNLLFAQTHSSSKEVLSKSLEKDIWWIIESKPKKEEVLKKFGPPDLTEKDVIYYIRHDYKYALSFTYKGGKLIGLQYKLPSNTTLSADDFKEIIPASSYKPYPDSGHEAGRYISAPLNEFNLQLLFKNTSDKQLDRIVYENK